MFRFSGCCLIALALLAAGACLTPAHAQVRRCMHPDGAVTYTDKHCAQIGAIERPAEHGGDDNGRDSGRIYRGGCPRTAHDLMFEMTLAFDTGDVNRLASLYHWAGMSSSAANAVMQRLDKLVQQPLIDIVPVSGAPAEAFDAYGYPAQPAAWSAEPTAVRIEQTRGDSVTPSRTLFALHRYFGCLWIRGGSSP